jgi:hypothetical protein
MIYLVVYAAKLLHDPLWRLDSRPPASAITRTIYHHACFYCSPDESLCVQRAKQFQYIIEHTVDFNHEIISWRELAPKLGYPKLGG